MSDDDWLFHARLRAALDAYTALSAQARTQALSHSKRITHQRKLAVLRELTGQSDPDLACQHARRLLGRPEPDSTAPRARSAAPIPTNIGPVELPELRAEIINWIDGPSAAQLWFKAAERGDYDWSSPTASADPSTSQSVLRGTEIMRLKDAALFYVAADMVDLVDAAARSVPDFQLAPEDLPARAGFMLFERPISLLPAGPMELGISAVCWAPMPGNAHVLMGSTYIDRAEVAPFFELTAPNRYQQLATEPRLIYSLGGEFVWEFGDNDGKAPASAHFMAALAPRLRAAWLLMRQPVTETTEVSLPRPVRRRLQRAGVEPPPVRLIQLRRPVSPRATDESAAAREFHHRWIVRGHWRRQWFPSRQVHRPVWIAPHLKGPEGAPLLGGDKVNVWKR